MDDNAIIDLYFARSENAIAETAARYGGYCYTIAYNILSNREDSEESVNDTYLAAWNTMPPKRPGRLAAFLGKITRYLSLDKWKQRSRLKRSGGEVTLCLDELADCVCGRETPEDTLIRKEVLRSVNSFLDSLSQTERKVFVCRYWYLDPVQDIADRFGYSLTKTASMLHRIRTKLNKHLAKEGLQ